MPVGYYYNTKEKKVVLLEMRKCIFRKKLHDSKMNKDYFRCTRDGSVRRDKSCYKCNNYVPTLWQRIKDKFTDWGFY